MQLAGVSALDAPTDEIIAAEVEDHLRAVLRRERDRWAAIDPWFAEPVDLLTRSTLAGGKRLRPLFCRYGFLAAGGDPHDRCWLDVAAGIELLHSFALIHDDVMDGSARRRGRPALHRCLDETHRRAGWRGEARRFGEGVSVLVGDLAFACADRLVRAAGDAVGAVWDELRTELMMGQYLDVVGACRGGLPVERALLVARYKSGAYTVERPLHLGAVLADADADLVEAFSAFGRPLGEAFQLRDDLLGVFGDEATTGKPVGEDLREGKPTVLLALARDLVGLRHARLLAIVGTPDLDEGDVARLRALLVDCGARDAVEQLIADRHAHALAALDGAPVPEAIGARLRSLAARAAWREA
jgi:geranylgeranyl diphosphate synthase type I